MANDARVLPAHVHWGAFPQPIYSAVAGSTTIPSLVWFNVDLSIAIAQHRVAVTLDRWQPQARNAT